MLLIGINNLVAIEEKNNYFKVVKNYQHNTKNTYGKNPFSGVVIKRFQHIHKPNNEVI